VLFVAVLVLFAIGAAWGVGWGNRDRDRSGRGVVMRQPFYRTANFGRQGLENCLGDRSWETSFGRQVLGDSKNCLGNSLTCLEDYSFATHLPLFVSDTVSLADKWHLCRTKSTIVL
jgi:hypothetical protein